MWQGILWLNVGRIFSPFWNSYRYRCLWKSAAWESEKAFACRWDFSKVQVTFLRIPQKRELSNINYWHVRFAGRNKFDWLIFSFPRYWNINAVFPNLIAQISLSEIFFCFSFFIENTLWSFISINSHTGTLFVQETQDGRMHVKYKCCFAKAR